jgi:hypothetical protein
MDITDVIEFASCRMNLRRDGGAQAAANILLQADPADHAKALVAAVTGHELAGSDIWVEVSLTPRQRAELRKAGAPQLSITGALVVVDVALLPSGGARISGRLERLDEAKAASLLSGGRVIHVPAREQAPERQGIGARRTR